MLNTNYHNILSILLNDLKLLQLNKISSLMGAIKTGTTKSDKCKHVNLYLDKLDQLIKEEDEKVHIMSMDTGIINFAWSTFILDKNKGEITLHNWNKVNLNEIFQIHETTFTPLVMSNLTTKLTQFILNQSSNNNMVYTIERQRLRTNSSKFITEPILNVNIFEHLLFHSLTNVKRNVMSSDPGRMTKFWLANQKHYSTKDSKKLRIETVNNLLNNGSIIKLNTKLQTKLLPWDLKIKNGRKNITIFDKLQLNELQNGKRKDDDLADSLLHGLSWAMWLRNYYNLRNELERDSEHLKLGEWVEYHWNEHINLLNSIKTK